MVTELRTYNVKPGKMDDWVKLFTLHVRPLRERTGFHVDSAYVLADTSQFVWIVTFDGTAADMAAADAAYYELDEHAPLHQEALGYLEGSASVPAVPVP
jgi:hypothetical protein